jgi:hypothetical protein
MDDTTALQRERKLGLTEYVDCRRHEYSDPMRVGISAEKGRAVWLSITSGCAQMSGFLSPAIARLLAKLLVDSADLTERADDAEHDAKQAEAQADDIVDADWTPPEVLEPSVRVTVTTPEGAPLGEWERDAAGDLIEPSKGVDEPRVPL